MPVRSLGIACHPETCIVEYMMVRQLCLLLGLASCIPVWAAQVANLEVVCLSPMMAPATVNMMGLIYELQLSTGPANQAANGELMLAGSESPTTHMSAFRLLSPDGWSDLYGFFYLNMPPYKDINTNGIHDFFDIDLPVEGGSSTGFYIDDYVGEEGTLSATWTRSASTNVGLCQLHMQSTNLDVTFNHVFSLPAYRGMLTYTPASNTVQGTIALRRMDQTNETLNGSIALKKQGINDLLLQAGVWTNQVGQPFTYLDSAPGETVGRNNLNYVSYLDVMDGHFPTSYEDYTVWLLHILDTNDIDQNGIPDLSDSVTAQALSIAISRWESKVQLTISGAVGRMYRIEQTGILPASRWSTIATFTLTNNPQGVTLDMPTSNAWWRVASP